MKDRICPRGCRCGRCYYGGFSGMKDYANHPDLGKRAGVRQSAEFASGEVVHAGTTGRILRVEPGAGCNHYILQIDGTTGQAGERSFYKWQLDFLTDDGRTM